MAQRQPNLLDLQRDFPADEAYLDEEAFDAFNRAVQGVPEIEQCHMMAVSFDYLLKVRTKDIAAYRRVLGERISALPHVAQTSTFVAMETVKDR